MKNLVVILSALLLCGSAFAQEETPAKFKLYGFIRNYMAVDSRDVNGGTHDLYFYMPKDISLSAENVDVNNALSWKLLSLTTRLGLDVSAYQFGNMKLSGKVEADFYSLNGTASANTIAQLRLRQAYVALNWGLGEKSSVTLNLGQTWHPMAVDMPHMTNLETGAPFNPFNRSPQVMSHWKVGHWTFTGGLLYLSQYLPLDMEASMTAGKMTKSVDPYKYGMPEFYVGAAATYGGFYFKLGATEITTKPVRNVAGVKAKGFLNAVSPFYFFQYTTPNKMFQLRTKTTLAQSGEHLNLLSGYGISKYDEAAQSFAYTPMQDFVTWVSCSYGKKFQVMGMLGYMQQLGTTEDLLEGWMLLLNSAAATNIQKAVRFTPTVAWNWGKFTLSLEYDITSAQYGNTVASGTVPAGSPDSVRNSRGLYEETNTHWVTNHRFLCMTKFNF